MVKSMVAKCFTFVVVIGLLSVHSPAAELKVGDILVTDSAALQRILMVIDPETGGQTQITPDGTFARPSDVDFELDGGILVADEAIGQVYRVDPESGLVTALLEPTLSVTKLGLTVSPTGRILVTGNTTPHSVREIEPDTGLTTAISEGGFLEQPRDLVVEADGNILVYTVTSPGRIVRVDPTTGGQVIVSEGGILADATGMALEQDGNIVVVSNSNDAVTRIDRVTGAQTSVTPDQAFTSPIGIAVDGIGTLLVVDSSTDELTQVDPVSGNLTTISSDGLLVSATNLAVLLDPPPFITYVPQFGHGSAGVLSLSAETAISNMIGYPNKDLDAAVTVTSFDDQGNPVALLSPGPGEAVDRLELSILGGASQTVSSASPAGAFLTGWLKLRSDVPVVAETVFAIRGEGGELITRANVTARSLSKAGYAAQSLLQPGGAMGNETAQSGVALLNPAGSGGEAVISLQPVDGSTASPVQIGGPINITLQPGEKVSTFLDLLSPGIPDFQGWVFIEVSGPPVWGVALEQRSGGVLTSRALTPLD